MYSFPILVSITPIVSGAGTALSNVEVLGVVNVLVGAGLYAIDDAWLQIYQDGSGDVSSVVTLVVEDIFPVPTLRREILEITILVDAVFLTELLPKLAANWSVLALPYIGIATARKTKPGMRY